MRAGLAAMRARRLLVICTRQIGDVLLTTPLIAAAKARWPDAEIDVLGFSGTLGILNGNPDVHAFVEVPPGSGWLRSLGLIRRLWRRYDLAFIAQYSDRAHLYGAVAARHRSGLVLSDRRDSWWKRALLDHAVTVDHDQTHAVLEKLRLIAPWQPAPAAIRVTPPPGAALPEALRARLAARHVVVHVPTLVRYKQWPIEHHVTLVRALAEEGLQVLLSGGPSEADRARTAAVLAGGGDAAAGDRVIDVAGTLDLNQLATLLKGAALYIGPDTSITHLAAAVETPIVAIYGPIDPRLWGPWPQGHGPTQPYVERALEQHAGRTVLLQGDQPCVPCSRAGCDRHNDSRSECLETLSPWRVLAQARRILGLPSAPLAPTIPIAPAQGATGRQPASAGSLR
jgi:heptosyltransferase-3